MDFNESNQLRLGGKIPVFRPDMFVGEKKIVCVCSTFPPLPIYCDSESNGNGNNVATDSYYETFYGFRTVSGEVRSVNRVK